MNLRRFARHVTLGVLAGSLLIAPPLAARAYMDNRDEGRARMARQFAELKVDQAVATLRAEQNARRIADIEDVTRQNCETLNAAARNVNRVVDYLAAVVRSSSSTSSNPQALEAFIAGLPHADLQPCPRKAP